MEEGIGVLTDFIGSVMNDFTIEMVKALATVFWYLEKIAAFITDFLTQENLWEMVLETLMSALSDIFPAILDRLLFGDGSGGLLYMALMLAGLFLILPNIGGTRLVDPGRVITWAVIIIALFVGSVWGYDLIGVMEGLRQGSTQIVIDAVTDTDSLSDLVGQPMQAEPAEIEDWTFALPSAFDNNFYPEPADSDYDTREMVILDNWVMGRWAFEFRIENEASQDFRTERSREGILMAGLTLVPAFVLLLFGITFATLAAAALVLIIFFLTALPLGFFEFGAPILTGIAKQYAYLFALTLAATILPGILVGAGTLAFSGTPNINDMIAYLPILIIVAIAAQYMAQMAFNAMKGTFGIVGSSLKASVGQYSVLGQLPDAGADLGNKASMGLAALAGAAVTGGVGGALMGASALAGQGGGSGQSGSGSGLFSNIASTVSGNGRSSAPSSAKDSVWNAPNASSILSETVMHTPGKLNEDKAAALALQDKANEMSLTDDTITKIFEAVHEAEKEADAVEDDDKNPIERTAEKIGTNGIAGKQESFNVYELARLATLVAASAKANTPKATADRVLNAPETIRGNQEAVGAMHQLAQKMELDQKSVESVFDAVKQGHKAGLSGQKQVQYVTEKTMPHVNGSSQQVEEMARLAVLVDSGMNGTVPKLPNASNNQKEKKS